MARKIVVAFKQVRSSLTLHLHWFLTVDPINSWLRCSSCVWFVEHLRVRHHPVEGQVLRHRRQRLELRQGQLPVRTLNNNSETFLMGRLNTHSLSVWSHIYLSYYDKCARMLRKLCLGSAKGGLGAFGLPHVSLQAELPWLCRHRCLLQCRKPGVFSKTLSSLLTLMFWCVAEQECVPGWRQQRCLPRPGCCESLFVCKAGDADVSSLVVLLQIFRHADRTPKQKVCAS